MPRIAITRAGEVGEDLARGWMAIPLTRRRTLPDGCRTLADIFARIESCGLRDASYSAAVEPSAAAARQPIWLAITSGFIFDVLAQTGIEIPPQLSLACVGAASAAKSPIRVDLIGSSPASARSLAAAFPDRRGEAGSVQVIFPCSALASSDLEEGLDARGYRVERVEVYTTEADPAGVERLVAAHPEVVVVTAGSAARALASYYPGLLNQMNAPRQMDMPSQMDMLNQMNAPRYSHEPKSLDSSQQRDREPVDLEPADLKPVASKPVDLTSAPPSHSSSRTPPCRCSQLDSELVSPLVETQNAVRRMPALVALGSSTARVMREVGLVVAAQAASAERSDVQRAVDYACSVSI
ncbi:MAG: uroporphyrinogen-III synthase [Actinomycetaceae bacterium]|nr:uroporphyrinogen-III synthase [Actinomycetaceae bacterium]